MTAGSVYVMIPGVDKEGRDVHGGFQCNGKAIASMTKTLIPVYRMVEEQGFKLFTQPRREGESYFLMKRNGGKQIWFDAMTKEQDGLDERVVFECGNCTRTTAVAQADGGVLKRI